MDLLHNNWPWPIHVCKINMVYIYIIYYVVSTEYYNLVKHRNITSELLIQYTAAIDDVTNQ
jgi:hypothetical protein